MSAQEKQVIKNRERYHVNLEEFIKLIGRISTNGIRLDHSNAIEYTMKCVHKYVGRERRELTKEDAANLINRAFI